MDKTMGGITEMKGAIRTTSVDLEILGGLFRIHLCFKERISLRSSL